MKTIKPLNNFSSHIINYDVAAIRSIISSHLSGVFSKSDEISEAIQLDSRVTSALESRLAAISSANIKITNTIDDNVINDLTNIISENKEIIKSIAKQYILLGFSLSSFEFLFNPDNNRFDFVEINKWTSNNVKYCNQTQKYLAKTTNGEIEIDNNYFCFVGGDVTAGICCKIATPWIIKNYAMRDWARWSEKYGMPLLKAKTPISGDQDQATNFQNSLISLGQETVVQIPQGENAGQSYDLEFVETNQSNSDSYDTLISMCNNEITQCILHQNLTTEVSGGSYAAAEIHNEVKNSIIINDLQLIANALNKSIVKKYCELNNINENVKIEFELQKNENTLEKVQILNNIIDSAQKIANLGYKVNLLALAKQHNLNLDDIISVNTNNQ